MAVPGRHVPAGQHRGDDDDAHGDAGGERAAGGCAGPAAPVPAGRRFAGGPPAATLAERESALPPSGRGTHAASIASRRTHVELVP
jgi:hypothetical protein